MKTYRGYIRSEQNRKVFQVTVQEDGHQEKPLKHIELHSPEGFSWGYRGSGPAELALSLLLDLFQEKPKHNKIGSTQAWRIHQAFKEAVISRFNMESGWVMTESKIREALEDLRPTRAEYGQRSPNGKA